MKYNHFGELLKEIRMSNNLTLKELADDICSIRQLSRIENGESNPSIYILHNLSGKLNIDLQEYYRIDFTSGSFKTYNLRLKIGDLIAQGKDESLKKLISELEDKEEFIEGENRQYILYGKAICSTYLDKDYNLSNKYCLKGIFIEDPSFNIDNMQNDLYSNISLTLINLMAGNFDRMGKKEISAKVLKKLMIILDNYILNNPFPMYRSLDFEKKLYQSTSCNLSKIYMYNKKYEESLVYVDKGISFSIKENYMRFLPELLAQKSRLLLKMGCKDEASETYNMCLNFYKLCRSQEEIQFIKKKMKDNFP